MGIVAASRYERRRDQRRSQVESADRLHLRLAAPRLAAALTALFAVYGPFAQSWFSGWWLALPVAALIALGRRMRSLEGARQRAARGVDYYARALDRLAGRWSVSAPDGARFLAPEHLYARDLDVLGEDSLFGRLCHARTGIGQATLAGWLLAPAAAAQLRARQAAVEELRDRLDLREDLAILGEDAAGELHRDRLGAWAAADDRLPGPRFRTLARLLSLLGAAALIALLGSFGAGLAAVDLTPGAAAGMRAVGLLTGLALGAVGWRLRRQTESILRGAESAGHELRLIAALLARFEREPAASARLQELRAALDCAGTPASERIAGLGRLMDLVDARHGSFVRMFGVFVLWDLHLAYALEDWRAHSGTHVDGWLSALGEVEALTSLATYRYENPDDVVPEIVDGGPCFEGLDLGHPLLRPAEIVRNDVRLQAPLQVVVVSGSNMSGKSTLLRAVGVNAVLALAGAPVCAKRLRLSTLAVGASITTRDSLHEGVSRFYAEITRLRAIVERCDRGAVLFLIDELLHGTNSDDRRAGAAGIVRGLVERQAIGLITTHDLALTEIADGLGPAAMNVHFSDELRGGRLYFDYRIRPGVVRRSNALELMRSVGLDV